ncbi:hypothetical protein CPAV1605_1366 [seawater metagenome]|uniref:Ferritin-like domain n=1 Tax=seawater metagenome TaxID=1561972 RepID=A0A5E8CL71_9ZZZZ
MAKTFQSIGKELLMLHQLQLKNFKSVLNLLDQVGTLRCLQLRPYIDAALQSEQKHVSVLTPHFGNDKCHCGEKNASDCGPESCLVPEGCGINSEMDLRSHLSLNLYYESYESYLLLLLREIVKESPNKDLKMVVENLLQEENNHNNDALLMFSLIAKDQ